MTCQLSHEKTDLIIKDIGRNQGGFGRHKCASCAYEKGVENGKAKVLNFDLDSFISSLPESQKGHRRHKSPLEAYSLGFFHGLHGIDNHQINKDRLEMASQMRDLGISMVAKGVVSATLSEHGIPYSHAMSVVHVAHGFEILLKSRIVEEHPLLIFKKVPKTTQATEIKMEDLLEHGQTIMYSELPERLWATTGHKINDTHAYENFGNIRNQIIHFSVPAISLDKETLKYVFNVIEIAINEWWDETIFDYVEAYDDSIHEYIFERLSDLGISTKYVGVDDSGNLIEAE